MEEICGKEIKIKITVRTGNGQRIRDEKLRKRQNERKRDTYS